MIISVVDNENKDLTLRELCQTLNISRRTVQGYEAQGLVAPSGRTNMGYLLYDSSAQQRVRRIRKYQTYGFQIKQIALLLGASDEVLQLELEKRLSELRSQSRCMDQTISELETEIDQIGQRKTK